MRESSFPVTRQAYWSLTREELGVLLELIDGTENLNAADSDDLKEEL